MLLQSMVRISERATEALLARIGKMDVNDPRFPRDGVTHRWRKKGFSQREVSGLFNPKAGGR